MVYSPHATVNGLFEEIATQSPDSIALVQPDGDGNRRLVTYRELDRRAGQLAARLRTEGVGAGKLVALFMDRSIEMIVAMLGVLKAGAAYAPMDPAHPRARLEYMIGDLDAVVCLASEQRRAEAETLHARVVIVPQSDEGSDTPALGGASAQSPAYVMYTSGSTGRPKGVVVPHRAIVRLVRGQSFARLDESRITLQLAPASFDASTFEIWGALLNGGRCVLAPEANVPDLGRIREIITETGVTTVWLTASLFNTIIDHQAETLATVSEVLTGGEALSVSHVRRAQAILPGVQFINGYGPTESTTFACCYRIPRPMPAEWSAIPIGAAIANTTVHVLDATLAVVPPGQPGDLFIGGDGLALGYLNLPELTATRFVDTPHGRLYRTGDRAIVRPDGTLDFLGRDDDQVKIRGYRVELGEIESALREVAGVANAVVMLREDAPGDKRLVAYYTLSDCIAGPSPKTLREHLETRMPEQMVPSVFSVLDAIPLTTNGKADRAALPAPGRRRPDLERPAMAPRTPLETWLASLWREVLQLDEVGVQDRFFELGGTSITAMRFLARMNQETTSPIPSLLLFRGPTIADLATILEREFREALPASLAGPAMSPARMPSLPDRVAQRTNELRERRLQRRRAN